MFPWLSRHVVLPLHERLLGRPTFSLYCELRSKEYREQPLISAQTQKLRSLFDHCRENLPWWKSRLSCAPSSGEIQNPRAALSEIPILTRSEIRISLEEMRWRDPSVKVIKHTSGGTTDDNLLFYCGRERQTWNRAMRFRSLARIGFEPGDPVIHLWPQFADETALERVKSGIRNFRDLLVDDREFDIRPFDAGHFEPAVRALSRYSRCVLFSYPSWVARLLEYWKQSRPGEPFHPGCTVYCSGEVLHEAQRSLFQNGLGVEVFEEYGSQETGAIANEDEQHVLRLNPEHVIVEILRDGRPAPPGELGEIIVTNLTAKLMPFIRYATGDVARQPENPSFPVDGVRAPRFPRVEGRTSDLLLSFRGELLPSRPLVDTLITVVGLKWFHIHQSSATALEIHVLGSDDGKRVCAEQMVRGYLGRSVEIGWRVGAAFASLRSGKHRYVCSLPAAKLISHDKQLDHELARAWPQPVVDSALN